MEPIILLIAVGLIAIFNIMALWLFEHRSVKMLREIVIMFWDLDREWNTQYQHTVKQLATLQRRAKFARKREVLILRIVRKIKHEMGY